MKYLVSALFLFLFSTNSWSFLIVGNSTKRLEKWSDYSKNDELNVRYLVNLLKKSIAGKKLLISAQRKARREGKSLFEIIKVGNASLTDTTLTRRFKAHNPAEVEFESSSVVYVNKYLSQKDALLDLAHELTHYVHRKPFNPYVKNFTLRSFIRSTVEGPGGEVNAFLSECKVLKELLGVDEIENSICRSIYDDSKQMFSRALAIKHFYHVGEHFHDFHHKLKNHQLELEFPEVVAKKALFISSAYGKPYPVAALEEYEQVMNKACANDSRRISLYRENAKRAPASLTKSYQERCQLTITH